MKDVLIVLPTYNEDKVIGQQIDQLFDFCRKNLTDYQWTVAVADNGSTDKTMEVVGQKKQIYPDLIYFHLPCPGKGAAIKKAWQDYTAQVNIFMDADLSVELKFIPVITKTILENGCGIAIGSRYQKASQLKRPAMRNLFSRVYNLILKLFFNLNLTDAHCGFKAVSREVVEKVIPQVRNDYLFFDTELLLLGRHFNFSIKEIPINWREGKLRKTKIKLFTAAGIFLKELIKLRWRLKKRAPLP